VLVDVGLVAVVTGVDVVEALVDVGDVDEVELLVDEVEVVGVWLVVVLVDDVVVELGCEVVVLELVEELVGDDVVGAWEVDVEVDEVDEVVVVVGFDVVVLGLVEELVDEEVDEVVGAWLVDDVVVELGFEVVVLLDEDVDELMLVDVEELEDVVEVVDELVDDDVLDDVDVLVVVTVEAETTNTVQPMGVPAVIGWIAVLNRFRTARVMFAGTAPAATTSKVTCATLTMPFGPSSRVVWRPAMMVEPLSNEAGLAVGVPANSAVLPPSTDAIVTIPGSYPKVTE
jgi:hypothetical protein